VLQTCRFIKVFENINDKLERNPREVWMTSGQKLCTNIIYIVSQTSVWLYEYLLKNNSNNTKCWKQILNSVWNTWKYWWNETDNEILPLYNISELWNIFSQVPMGNCFRCYFRQLFVSLALRKCKKDCKITNYSGTRFLSPQNLNCLISYRILLKSLKKAEHFRGIVSNLVQKIIGIFAKYM